MLQYQARRWTLWLRKSKSLLVGENEFGIVLPENVLRHLKVGLGDELLITEVSGGFELSPFKPQDTEKERIVDWVMRDNR
jgi:hypothetical protein